MKKIIFILVCSFMILSLTGCGNKYKGQGTELLKEHGDVALHIDSGNKGNCIKVMLVLYEDNQYELFTDYKECRPWQTCTEELRYTKSIKGTYNYDLTKIIEASTNANDKSYSKDNLPEYELYLGDQYVQKYDTAMFVVEKGQTNNYLDELLEQLDVDLNSCANPDYVK